MFYDKLRYFFTPQGAFVKDLNRSFKSTNSQTSSRDVNNTNNSNNPGEQKNHTHQELEGSDGDIASKYSYISHYSKEHDGFLRSVLKKFYLLLKLKSKTEFKSSQQGESFSFTRDYLYDSMYLMLRKGIIDKKEELVNEAASRDWFFDPLTKENTDSPVGNYTQRRFFDSSYNKVRSHYLQWLEQRKEKKVRKFTFFFITASFLTSVVCALGILIFGKFLFFAFNLILSSFLVMIFAPRILSIISYLIERKKGAFSIRDRVVGVRDANVAHIVRSFTDSHAQEVRGIMAHYKNEPQKASEELALLIKRFLNSLHYIPSREIFIVNNPSHTGSSQDAREHFSSMVKTSDEENGSVHSHFNGDATVSSEAGAAHGINNKKLYLKK